MKTLSIDIETYSSADLSKTGVYRYSESPDFEILLFSCSVDGGPVVVYDLASGEKLPEEILAALTDETVIKTAFNAQFERVCLSRYLYPGTERFLSPKSWHCTMVWAATLGLPFSLDAVGKVLGLEKQKMKEGKSLIRYFCCPCKPTKRNGGRIRNRPSDDPLSWEIFKSYNRRDVETEMGIQARLAPFPVPESEWKNYQVDQIINDRGVAIDEGLADEAIRCDSEVKEELMKRMRKMTGLTNPNSVLQLKDWLKGKGINTETLGREQVEELRKDAAPDVREVLNMRLQAGKSSVSKYTAMKNAVCQDGRARGLFRFYGASRTGRYSSRLIQLQNLPRNMIPDLAEARALVRNGDFDTLFALYDNVPDILSQLIRTAFIPEKGSRFIVADFSAIEARVIAWMAGEKWREKVFSEGGDIYCASATAMFHVPVVKHGVNGELRQKGKIAELALGYGGGVGALTAMGALKMGLSEDELPEIVEKWRKASPHIVKLWWDIDKAVKAVVAGRVSIPSKTHGIKVLCRSGILFLVLPSGRKLAYRNPGIGTNKFGGDSITYDGIKTGAPGRWGTIESYGPKFVENIVQATARDILAGVMARLTKRGYRIVMHIHDEVVVEVPKGESSVEEICGLMGETPSWAEGLKLRADGYECPFYQKD